MHTLELSVSFCNSSFIIVDYTRADPGFPEEGDANLEIGRIGQGRPPWVWSFLRKFAKLCDTPGFWENVLDRFSCFYIQIAYIQTLISVAVIRSVFWHVTQFQQNEHTPEADP